MLWGKTLRSPLPHARILRVDTSRARRLAGVHAVLTGADIPDVRVGRRMRDMPVLTRDKVRFLGEKVAAVAAADEDVAEEALELIDVEYEELPAVFDALEALQPGAPIVHEGINAYEGLAQPVQEPTNLFSQLVWTRGDIREGFARADMVFEHTFTVPRVHQAYLEPHACVVRVDSNGRAEVWANNKTPFLLRNQLAQASGLPPEHIRVNTAYIGGDFGGKGSFMDVPLTYFLARASGQPVKMVMDYTEELQAGNPRHPAFMTIRSGVLRDGTVVAREARCVFNSGAYAAFKPTPGANIPGAMGLSGSYRIPHLHIVADCVYTNTVPNGHHRAPGSPQAVFAEESHMDMIAKALNMDPLEIRLRNVYQEGDKTPSGPYGEQTLVQVRGEATLRRAAEVFGWGTPKAGPSTGRGMALYDRHTGGGQSSATVMAQADGTITLRSPTLDQGAGTHTILRQLIAEELTIPLEMVRVVTVDTDSSPFDGGVGGSRVTHCAGQATLQAVQGLRQRLATVAAELLGVPEERLRLQNGRFVVQGDRTSIPLAQVASTAAAHGPVAVEATYNAAQLPEVTSFCAQIAEVEVDPETGQVKVRRFLTAHDVGTVLNPLTHQGQIEGGIAVGLGYALMEELKMEDGQVQTLHFGDYKIPTARDIPELTTVLLEEPSGPTPYQGKGIGEVSNCPVAGAIANAVADAIGVHITSLPITAEKVLAALKSQGRPARA
ncbi:MAG: xanthine dehydrogenase family protein molybdopterin-binding subunit [Chloroflexi bacterium]|nr:xanthine dehydrogenase family protein molybdopterin-binding subunit [Chloroflexota bacterium]